MNEANRNLVLRVISAAVLAPPVVLLIFWRRPEGTALLVHLACALALVEFYGITLKDRPAWLRGLGVLLGVGVSATMVWAPKPELLNAALVGSMLVLALAQLVHLGDSRTAGSSLALLVMGLLYVPLLLTPLALLKKFPDGASWIVLVLTITWFADTGAYFAGRALGRHKLYPAVSPGKTVEGAVGGLLASFGAAALAKAWYLPSLSWLDAAAISLPASALGQAGDLVESMLKRAYQVKDSGRLIPGHGGLLDRIDALLFCAPYVYLYARYVIYR